VDLSSAEHAMATMAIVSAIKPIKNLFPAIRGNICQTSIYSIFQFTKSPQPRFGFPDLSVKQA
jgi:hypothetical protein